MMRTTGFLLGVCLTVAAVLLILDSWESQQPAIVMQTTADTTPAELSGVAAAIAEQVDILPVEIKSDQAVPPDPETAMADGELQSGFVETTTDLTAEEDPDEPQNGFEASGLDQEHRLDVQAEAQTEESDRENSGDAGTYLFWSPFRSAWSAQGFAGRLSSATQVPVEVITAGPGEYRVAFSYQDESERLARIEHIETITGLKLE